MKDKIIKIFASIKRNLAVTACVALVFLVIIILVAVFSTAGEEAENNLDWGDGITEDIPAFTGEGETLTFGESGEYAAAFYKNVSSEQAEEYIRLLEEKLSVDFTNDNYPKSAIYGEKIIALHYNITEMTFSVTVAAKGDAEASKEITQSGEQQ